MWTDLLRVWTDKASGSLDLRPKLEAVFDHLRPGGTLVVRSLNGLALPERFVFKRSAALRSDIRARLRS